MPDGQAQQPLEGGGMGPVTGAKNATNDSTQDLIKRVLGPALARSMGQGTSHLPTPQAQQKSGQHMQLQGIMGLVQNAVREHKEKQTRVAMADWMGLQAAHERAEQMAGDPTTNPEEYQKKVKEFFMKDPVASAIVSDPKKMKNMAKAFAVDLLNPEKTTVYGDALKRAMAADKAGKMMRMMRTLHMSKKPEAQLSGQEQQKFGEEMSGRVESMRIPNMPDTKTLIEAARLGMDKYEFKQGVGSDGKTLEWKAFDKTNPHAPGITVQIDGESVKIPPKSTPKAGQVLTIKGKPYAVGGADGKPVEPGREGWDDKMQASFDAANKAWAATNAEQERLAGIRASTYINSREYGVVASEDIPELNMKAGDMRTLNPNVINKFAGQFAPVGGAGAAMAKEAVFKDIDFNIKNVRDASAALKHGLSPAIRSQMILALRSSDPHQAFSSLLSSQAAASLSPDVMDYMTALASLQENAMAIRSVAGMGQGAQDLREAILRAIPGPGTPNASMLKRQLDLFQGTADRLRTGVPGVIKNKVITDPKDLD